MSPYEIADAMLKRLTSELGYKSASHYPIYESTEGNRIMYYMVSTQPINWKRSP